jgi:hypothetical protein
MQPWRCVGEERVSATPPESDAYLGGLHGKLQNTSKNVDGKIVGMTFVARAIRTTN